eukprot:sb/3479043/
MGYTKRGVMLRIAATVSALYTLTFTVFVAVRTCTASYTTDHPAVGKKQLYWHVPCSLFNLNRYPGKNTRYNAILKMNCLLQLAEYSVFSLQLPSYM